MSNISKQSSSHTLPEHDLEERVASHLHDILRALDKDDDAQVYTSLGASGYNLLKGNVQRASILCVVKASPRSYNTPTVPECQINIQIHLSVMADSDAHGQTYIRLVTEISRLIERWQLCLDDAHNDLDVDSLILTGVQMTGGDTSIDRDTPAYEMTQGITVYCIVDFGNQN